MNGLVRDGFVVLGGPLEDELRVVLAVSARSEEDVRATLSRDPWSGSLLEVECYFKSRILLRGVAKSRQPCHH